MGALQLRVRCMLVLNVSDGECFEPVGLHFRSAPTYVFLLRVKRRLVLNESEAQHWGAFYVGIFVLNNAQITEMDYSSNIEQHYQALCCLPGFVLLHSSDKKLGRYDIISAYPYERIIIDSTTDIFTTIDYLNNLMPPHASSGTLPFQGGLIGYISYDFGAQLMGIYPAPQSSLQPVPLLNLGLYDWAIIADHHLKKTYLYVGNQHPKTQEKVDHVLSLWNQKASDKRFSLKTPFHPLMPKEQYEYSFFEIQKALKAGRSYQVNFTQPFISSYEGDSWAIYQQISSQNPVPFAAFLKTEAADVLSFSPERFLFREKNVLLTSPIKGTSRRSASCALDEQLKNALSTSHKNRAENVMIVDLLRNDLGKIAVPGSVKVTRLCALESYNAVHHLVSDIIAEPLPEQKPLTLFLSCFPGGSITGAPKLEAMRIINELELYGRGVYCGSIVYFSRHGRFDSNIAIRTLIAKHNTLHLAAGGGIVIDSDCEDEYNECLVKIKAIMNGLML